ncbi:MAG: hypothetical protein ACW96M_05755 [Candidatus Thorarchaeota archaeon]
MKERIYREYGSLLTVVGLTMLLIHTLIFTFSFIPPIRFPSPFTDPRAAIVFGFLPLGIILTCSGVIIRRRFGGGILFLIKDGEPIHSGKPWYEGFDSGLFLTSCGLVVSIDQESRDTAHVGYKIVAANRATHKECVQNEGRAVLENVSHGRPM